MAALTSSHTASTVTCQRLFQGYHLPMGVYDEVFAAPGVLRPHWERVVQMLDSLGAEQARRRSHENGATYNVYGAPQGMHRAAPGLVIAPAE